MRALSVLALVICLSNVHAQDSLFSFKDISYSSDFEKKAFQNYFKNREQEPLPLFLAVTASMNDEKAGAVEQRIKDLVKVIEASGLEKKKTDKKIKSIYDLVHNPILKKYELENRFYEIFQTGNYNCVTATALYAMVFTELGIPYQIKEEPTHVSLISYPDKENILVETTSPMFGYVTFSDEFKNKFVYNLKKQKIIGQEESDSKTTDQLFNKYYFKKENISLTELIGIHYMNDALFLKDKSLWKEGYHQLEKAYLFYPSTRCKYLLMLFGSQIVANEKMTPIEKSLFVSKISKFSEHGITPDMIRGEFINLTQDLLFRQNNKTLYQECYDIYRKNITDQGLLKEINLVYQYENGRAYYNIGNYVKAKPFFEEAIKLEPNNLDVGGVMVSIIAQSMRSVTEDAAALDTLVKYKTKYPTLTQFANFNAMLANANLLCYGDAFEKGKPDKAKKYKDDFDALLKENTTLEIAPSVVGKAYGSACTYYFRRGMKAQAREVLNEGLKISPDNYQLRVRLQMIR